jgi:hypothetical protein
MSRIEWYYAEEDQQVGPVTSSDIKRLAQSGRLKPDDLVWREGMDMWMPARSVQGLFDGKPLADTKPSGEKPAATPARQNAEGERQATTKRPNQTPNATVDVESTPSPEASAEARAPASRRAEAAPGAAVGEPDRTRPTDAALPTAGQGGDGSDETPPGEPQFMVDGFLDRLRLQLNGHFVQSTTALFAQVGHYGLYLGMLLLLVFGMSVAVAASSPTAAFLAMAGVLLFAMLQYTAARFIDVLHRLNRSTPAVICSTALPDSVALLNMVAGLAALVGLAVVAVQSGKFLLLVPAVGVFILCQFVAVVCLNLHSVNLAVHEGVRAGQEAIGAIAFLAKLQLRVAPVAFGVGVGWGVIKLAAALALLYAPPAEVGPMGELLNPEEVLPAEALAELDAEKADEAEASETDNADAAADADEAKKAEAARLAELARMIPARGMALDATFTLLFFGALPLLTYFGVAVVCLGLDVARAILAMPGRLQRR